MQAYRARNPRQSPLWQCAHRHYDEFEEMYPEQYQPRFGPLRPIIPEVVHKFLNCGDLARGFARIRCDHCQHEYLLAFSCKSRWFCPACHQKNVQTTARFILEHVVAPVPHRHYVLAIPRMLRPYFQRHRHLLRRLCVLAQESLAEYLRTALDCPKGVPGLLLTLHTFGEYLDFHPHIHALVADGLFVREEPPPSVPAPTGQAPADTAFVPLPESPLKPLEELFRAKVIALLVTLKLLPPERVQVLYSWKHSGFNLHAGEAVPPENKADLENLAQYILRNFEVFTPTDFLAATCLPAGRSPSTIQVRSAKVETRPPMRLSQDLCGFPNSPFAIRHSSFGSPPPPLKLPSKKWRDLILRVWHVDPLRCPVCQHPMRGIAVIDDPQVVEKILRHLGAWHDPPARPPPSGDSGPYTYEPCDDVDPMPDYENALTD